MEINMKKIFIRAISLVLCLALLLPTLASCSADYTVEFYVAGKLYHTMTTNGREAMEFPEPPVKEGYAFKGWFTDENYTTEFKENYFKSGNPRTNMKVYAGFMIDDAAKIDFFGDLSKYVSLSPEDYHGFTVIDTVEPVTERDLEMAILKLLRNHKGELIEGANESTVISAGDIVTLKYRGFTYDENGHRNYFDGGCNFTSSVYNLEIGSGSFIIGFELGLNGKDTAAFARLEELTEGTVTEGDTISVTFTAKKDGKESTTTALLLDLNSTDIDSKYGTGFKDFLIGKTVGEKLTGLNEGFALGDGEVVYTSISVNKVFRATGGEVLTVEAYFPNDYKEATLRGKTAYFECYVSAIKDYATLDYNDSFVTDVVQADIELYGGYPGETAAEKYRAYLNHLLEVERLSKVDALKEEALLDCLGNAATVKEYPAADLYEMYESLLSQVYSEYQNYSQYYSFPQFVKLYYNLDDKTDPEAYMLDRAKLVIREKLAFHYAASIEGITLEGNALNKKVNELVEDYLEILLKNYGVDRGDFNTDSEYEAQVQAYRKQIVQYYGMEYFEYEAFYNYAMKELCKLAEVKKG